MVSPRIEDLEAFTVAGLHYEGTNEEGGITDLWKQTRDRESTFSSLKRSDSWYGISYGGDPETGEFEYVAGVRADPDIDPPDPMTVVDVPAATYVRFSTTLTDIEAAMEWVHSTWLPESGYDMAMGPECERYPPDFDRSDPDAEFEVFVPVESTEE